MRILAALLLGLFASLALAGDIDRTPRSAIPYCSVLK